LAEYISMLRGINVGPHKRIRMLDLIALYESLGFKNIRTYLQSGNVIFEASEVDGGTLFKLIGDKIKQVFGFQVEVLIRTPDELAHVIKDNPFLKDNNIDTANLYVTFLSDLPGQVELNKIKENRNETDSLIIFNKEVYLYCPNGYGSTRYSNDFFEKKLGLTATTRNWKTVNALLEMANSRTG
jgi:uncharacterized protein (DUF1697 family)